MCTFNPDIHSADFISEPEFLRGSLIKLLVDILKKNICK